MTLACKAVVREATPPVQAEWNLSPAGIVLEVIKSRGAPGGSAEKGFGPNYIPEARLWGSGRIIWVTPAGSGAGRTVWQGQLSPAELQGVLKKVSDAGYFSWKERYAPVGPYDNPPFTQVKASLVSGSRSVMVVFNEGPPGYQELLDILTRGAGASPAELTPASAYLIAYEAAPGSGEAPLSWDGAAAGFSLDQAPEGHWVVGAALQQAWQAVNRSPLRAPLFESNGKSYAVRLRVPGITLDEPPPEPVLPATLSPPAPLTPPAGQPAASPVTGQVLIENGRSATGGTAGQSIQVTVNFSATSSAGPVTEMRLQVQGNCKEMPAGSWEPFATHKEFPFTPPINWVTWSLSAQFRDAQGNLSPVVCDDIGVEGMPPVPTAQP